MRPFLYNVNMRTLYWLLVFALFGINSAVAQGTVLFTWHGDSNFFQATFQVPGEELQPGTHFGQLFLDGA